MPRVPDRSYEDTFTMDYWHGDPLLVDAAEAACSISSGAVIPTELTALEDRWFTRRTFAEFRTKLEDLEQPYAIAIRLGMKHGWMKLHARRNGGVSGEDPGGVLTVL